MNEARDTRCPLCGAPVMVDELGYHYQEPSPPPGPIIYGYQLEHLQVVAELLRKHNVTPEDLHDLKDNFQRALDIVSIEHENMMRRQMDGTLRALQHIDEWDELPSSRLYEQARAAMARRGTKHAAGEVKK